MIISLNFRRVFLFSIFILAARFFVGFLYGVVSFDSIAIGSAYYILLNFIVYPAAIIAILMRLGIKQENFLYAHVFLVVILSEILDMGFSFLLSFFVGRNDSFSSLLLLEYGIYIISIFVGVGLGKRVRISK